MPPLKPYNYQEEAIARCIKSDQLIADECGLGKTLIAIETVKRLRATKSPEWQRPVLVLAPKSSGWQWTDMIFQQAGDEQLIYQLGQAGRGLPEYISDEDANKTWIISHYEALLHVGSKIQETIWSVIIADEAHRIKNRKAQRAKWLKSLTGARKIALTGTPMEKSPADLWSILNWVDHENFRSYWAWWDEYVDSRRNWAGYIDILGAKNLEKLSRVVSPYMLRRTKEEVAPQLPPKIMQRIGVQMLEAQENFYRQIQKAKDIELELEDMTKTKLERDPLLIKNVLSKIIRLQQVSSDPRLLELDAKSGKLDWALDYILDNPDEPIVVFTKFRETAIHLGALVMGDVLVGGTKTFAQSFLTGKTNVLVGTIAAMGESLNLQRAKTAIFIDQEWSTIRMVQAVDRIHRIDSKTPKNIIFLHSVGTVDDLVLTALDTKYTDAEIAYEYIRRYA
jgi:SNF2 family DNA or RNA helicase